MPMETLLTLVIVLGVPLWLTAEELMHRFGDQERGSDEPAVVARPTPSEPRRVLETSSHVA
jgi:hypothetical protein